MAPLKVVHMARNKTSLMLLKLVYGFYVRFLNLLNQSYLLQVPIGLLSLVHIVFMNLQFYKKANLYQLLCLIWKNVLERNLLTYHQLLRLKVYTPVSKETLGNSSAVSVLWFTLNYLCCFSRLLD